MESLVYRAIDDPIYDLTSQLVPKDKDTPYRSSQYVTSSSRGSLAQPLNTGSRISTFDFTQGSAEKLRFGTLALRMRMVFANRDKDGPVPTTTSGFPLNSPSPWLVGQLINSVSVQLNTGTTCYKSSPGYFQYEYIARMIRQFTFEAIKYKSDELFTPLDSSIYVPCLPDGVAVPDNVNGLDMSWANRGFRWCDHKSHMREITKIVPISSIMPTMPDAVYKNLRKVTITIEWQNETDLLEHRSDDPATKGYVYLIDADLLTDYYVQSPAQATAAIQEKLEGTPDYLPFLRTTATLMDYSPGCDIFLPSQKNLDSVMIFQVAKGNSNGKAGDNLRTYAGVAQFLPFTDGVASNNHVKESASTPLNHDAGQRAGVDTLSIVYGSTQYPQSSIQLVRSTGIGNNSVFDSSQLYYEYLKTLNRFNSRHVTPAIHHDLFRTTMPFALLRPWGNNAARLCPEGRDLIIRMRGGVPCKVMIITFNYAVDVLNTNGTSTLHD